MSCPDALRHVFPLSPFPRQGILHGMPPLHALREGFPARCPDLPARSRFGPFRPLLPYLPDTPGFGPLQYPDQRPRPVRPVGRFFRLLRPRTFCQGKRGNARWRHSAPRPNVNGKTAFLSAKREAAWFGAQSGSNGKRSKSAGRRATGNRRPPLPFRAGMPPGCGPNPRQTAKSTHQQTTLAVRRQKKATRLKNSRGPPPCGQLLPFSPRKNGQICAEKISTRKSEFLTI